MYPFLSHGHDQPRWKNSKLVCSEWTFTTRTLTLSFCKILTASNETALELGLISALVFN